MDAHPQNLLNSIKKAKLTIDFLPPEKAPSVVTTSHLGGKPYMLEEEETPVCHHCQQNLSFVCQLNVPSSENDCDLYVFYYCFQCNPKNGNEGFSVLQYQNPSLEKAKQEVEISKVAHRLFDFEIYWSLPDWETLSLLHPKVADYYRSLDDEEYDIEYEDSKEEFLDTWNYDTFSFYGGYANFLNEPQFPTCDCCDTIMKPWLQLDSYDELGLKWHNFGVLHLFRCADDKDNFKILIQ